jgi:MFS family permease
VACKKGGRNRVTHGGVREARRTQPSVAVQPAPETAVPQPARKSSLLANRRFAGYLLAVVLFTLGNSADTFLVLRALELGIPVALGPLLWVVLHISRSAWAVPGGVLADRYGRMKLILAGWLVYGLARRMFGEWPGRIASLAYVTFAASQE